jgi:protease II
VHGRQRGSPERIDARAKPQVLLDVAQMAEGQAFFQLGSYAVSPDARWLGLSPRTSSGRSLWLAKAQTRYKRMG